MIIATSRWLPLILVAGLTACQAATPVADVPSSSPSPTATTTPWAWPTPPDIRWVPGLPEALEPSTVPFETVLKSSRGEIESGGSNGYVNEQAAFNSQAELDAFLKRHPRVVPPIDFTTKTAIAILLHAEPTTANTVEIMRIQEHPNGLIVYSVRWLPNFGAAGGQIVGVPFHLVTIPKTDRQVIFKPIVSALGDMYPADRQPVGEEFPATRPALRTTPEAQPPI